MEGLLAQAGVTREDLALQLDVSGTTIRNWIGGRTAPTLNPEQYETLLKLLGATPAELTAAWKESTANRVKRKPGRKKRNDKKSKE